MQTFRKYAVYMLLAAAGISTHGVHAAQDAMSRAEARQTIEDRTPQAQFQTSKREANAAYQEALAECKKLRGTERNNCMSEAKSNLQSDLAAARKAMTSGQ